MIPGPAPADVDPAAVRPDVEQTVAAWVSAWSGQRADDYLTFYAREFQPPAGQVREEWQAQRRLRIERPSTIDLTLGPVEILASEADRVSLGFEQLYTADSYSDRVWKVLDLVWEDDRWKIARERARVIEPAS